MTFATRHTPIGGVVPAAEQRWNHNQSSYPNGMKQQHNSLLSVLLDKKEAHSDAVALCNLARPSAAADSLPISMPPYSSSRASSLLEANRGTFVGGDRCPPPSASLLCLHVHIPSICFDIYHLMPHRHPYTLAHARTKHTQASTCAPSTRSKTIRKHVHVHSLTRIHTPFYTQP